jgi:hypothetical protein
MADNTRDIFDVMSTYFVNCYWNELFKHANDAFVQQQFPTLGESYCEMVERYRRAFTDLDPNERVNHNYDRILKDIHNSFNFYFQSQSSYSDFIDTISKQFIPRDLYASLPRQDRRKDEMVRRVLTKVVNTFSMFTATEGLVTVTQGRGQNAQQNMMNWKVKGIELFNKERSDLYARAMAGKTGVDPNKKEGISREAFEKMQEKIKELIHEKADLRKKLNSHAQYINLLKRKIAESERDRAEAVAVADPRVSRRTRLPKITAVEKAIESSEDDDEEEEEEEAIPRINDPEEKDQNPHNPIGQIAAPLDDLSEYSGEDFVNAVELGESSMSDDAMSADE